jgi:dipeptidyl aminopeptidase/acylaminoacyl peptidase
MVFSRLSFIVLLSFFIAACSGKNAVQVINEIPGADPLIPFELLLQGESYAAPKISPDGKQLVVLAELGGAMNLMLASTDAPDKLQPLTHDSNRGLQVMTIWSEPTFRWMPNNTHIVYLRDDKGDENWTLYSLDTDNGLSRQLTPAEGVRVRGLQVSAAYPDEVLFSMNDRDATKPDYYRANVATGKLTHITSSAPFVMKFFDHEFRERVSLNVEPTMHFVFRKKIKGEWQPFLRVDPRDAETLGSNHLNGDAGATFSADNRHFIAFSSQELNTNALVRYDVASGKREIIAQEPRVDIKEALLHPQTLQPQAYIRHFTGKEWVVLDKSVAADFKFLHTFRNGELFIESRSADDRTWIVSYMRPDAPTTYYLYRRGSSQLTKLGVSNPELAKLPLSDMHPVVTKSSDGFDLVSYISYPSWIAVDTKGMPEKPVPTITIVHGGPSDERAQYGFAPLLQRLTNRGYGVFVVNFRGSPGFGKAFMDAQNGEWGGAMNRDVIEQVQYLVDNKMADPARLAVFGGSYGGYETLVAMTMSAGVFACGNAVVGPANLETFMDPATMPPGWNIESFARRLGDPRTEAGRKLLRERSPLTHAAKTRGKMLVVQGDNDIRVPTRESDQIVAAMAKAGVEVTYLLYPDEGHGLVRRENNSSFMAISEIFFGECLGGRYQPLDDKLEGSSVQVPVGVEHIPGLDAALKSRRSDGLLQLDTSIDPASYSDFVGEYAIKGFTVTVTIDKKSLFIDVPGQGKFELLPFEADGFFLREAPTRFVFRRSAGNVSAVAMVSGDGEQVAERK